MVIQTGKVLLRTKSTKERVDILGEYVSLELSFDDISYFFHKTHR